MKQEAFQSFCRRNSIHWNSVVRIKVLRPKKFFGFFRKLTGVTIEGALGDVYTKYIELCVDEGKGRTSIHVFDYEEIISIKLINN